MHQDVPAPGTTTINPRYIAVFFGGNHGQGIERILQVFGKKEEPDSTEEALLDFLSKKPGTQERANAVEEVEFLKDLRT